VHKERSNLIEIVLRAAPSSVSLEAPVNLSAPSQVVFIIAVVIAIIAIIGVFVAIPFVSAYAFWIMTLAFVILAGACLMRGT
jgi:uncharacterized membrane protein